MPLYQFECLSCELVYEEFTPYDEKNKYKSVKCPSCSSKKKKKLISCCNHNFTNPVGTDLWNNEQTGHDYRFKHNLPNVLKQRENAERNSHVGPKPYRDIDDISSGNNFGEVK